MFSDTIYGGKESARRAAKKYKRGAMADLPELIFRGPISAAQAARTSKSKAKAKTAAKRGKTRRR
jgi:hypothetical protein